MPLKKLVPLTSKTVVPPVNGKQKITDPDGTIRCNSNNKISLKEMMKAINENTGNVNDFEIRISDNEANISINVKRLDGHETRIAANENDIRILYTSLGTPGGGFIPPSLIRDVEENTKNIDLLFIETESLDQRIKDIDLGDETNTERLNILEPIVKENTDDIVEIKKDIQNGVMVGDATATHAGVIRAVLTQNINGLWVLSMTNDGTYA